MTKRYLFLFFVILCCPMVFGQSFLKKLEVSASLGSTGIGVEASGSVNKYFDVRVGFDIMPPIKTHPKFTVSGMKDDGVDLDDSTFVHLADLAEDFTTIRVKNEVEMVRTIFFYNAKLLVDIYPFIDTKSKFWKKVYVTAGFYYGNSGVAYAENKADDAQTLVAVNVYNTLYDRFMNLDEDGVCYYQKEPFFGQVYLDEDEVIPRIQEGFAKYGRLGVRIGDYSHDIYDEEGNLIHKKGDPYLMRPNWEGMVTVDLNANKFKPFLGCGYKTEMKNNWSFSVDMGAMFWGGVPSMKLHDGTDFVKDLENIQNKYIRKNVREAKLLKVFPVLNVKISKRLF